jgi:peptide/nickel transport system substrate-binding protein
MHLLNMNRRMFWILASALVASVFLAVACAAEPAAAPKPQPTAKPASQATAIPTAVPAAKPIVADPSGPAGYLAKNATPWVTEGYDGLDSPKFGGVLRIADRNAGPQYDIQQEGTCGWCVLMYGPRYDNLVRHREDSPGTIVPDLAESWDLSADGKVYTFKLRQGVKFHDGSDFNVHDVIATYQRIANPPEGVVSTRTDWFKDVTSMEAVDDYTFRITLSRPLAYFMDYLAYGQMVINSKEFLEANNYSFRTVKDFPGTGPFIFKELREGQSITMERNPNYWNGDLPFLDGIQHFKLDRVASANAMLSGRLDELRGNILQGYKIMEADPAIRLLPQPGLWAYYFWMNRDIKPFDDVRVRQALNLIWNRPALYQATKQFRIMTAGDGFVPGGSAWQAELTGGEWRNRPGNRGVTDADVAEAKSLLNAAGYANGLGEIEVSIRGPLVPVTMYHAQSLQSDISRYLGSDFATFKYKSQEFAKAKHALKNNEFEAFSMASCFCEVDHPIIWLYSYWHSDGGNALANYNNPAFDSLVDRMIASTDRSEQVTLGKQALEILWTDMPAIPNAEWGTNMAAQRVYVRGSGLQDMAVDMHSAFRRDTTYLNQSH